MQQPDLTGVREVKDYLNKKTPEGETLLEDMVTAASGLIREHTGRKFSVREAGDPPEAREMYVRDYQDRIYLDEVFSTMDVLAILSPDGLPVPHFLRPHEGSPIKGVWCHFGGENRLPRGSYPADHANLFIYEYRDGQPRHSIPGRLTVTARFGWTKIPPQIEFATRTLVKYWHETQVAHFGRQFDAVEGRTIIPEHLPSMVEKLLRSWKVPDVAVLA